MSEAAIAATRPDAVAIEKHGAVTALRLAQPEKMNALSRDIAAGLSAGVDSFFADAAARALVITGTDKAFCAGGDVRTMTGEKKPLATRGRLHDAHRWVRQLLEGEKPVITAVNGAAVGAGLSLALMGDVVIAAEDAYFAAGFPGVGVVPDLSVIYTLPRAIGFPRAKDLLFSNRRVPAKEALEMGLVSRVVPTAALRDEALKLAGRIASGPSVSFGLTKTLMRRAFETSLDGFLELEALAQATNFTTGDFAEGVAAFLAKRKPEFKGT